MPAYFEWVAGYLRTSPRGRVHTVRPYQRRYARRYRGIDLGWHRW